MKAYTSAAILGTIHQTVYSPILRESEIPEVAQEVRVNPSIASLVSML